MKLSTALRIGGAAWIFSGLTWIGTIDFTSPVVAIVFFGLVAIYEILVVRRLAQWEAARKEPVALRIKALLIAAMVILAVVTTPPFLRYFAQVAATNLQPIGTAFSPNDPIVEPNALKKGSEIPPIADAKIDLEKTLVAARNGDLDAQVRLSQVYLAGRITPVDLKQSASWAEAAASKGHAAGEFQLGLLYQLGRAVPKDERKAEALFLKAANKGHEQSISHLSSFYSLRVMGELINYLSNTNAIPNLRDAYFWSLLAAARGDAFGIHNRDTVEKYLSNTARIDVQERAGKWQPVDK